jgi:hypothetical protein
MGLTISVLTGIQYLGKQVEIIQSETHDDMVMYEGEPTTNFMQVDHAGYPMHAGVLVDGGYYYYKDNNCVDITYGSYGRFVDYTEDFFNKQRTPNPLINLTDFTDCQGVISNKMCVKICASLCSAVLAEGFKYPENTKFLTDLIYIFERAATQNGIVVYW